MKNNMYFGNTGTTGTSLAADNYILVERTFGTSGTAGV